MDSIYRATRQGFVESVTLAGALTVALAKGAQTLGRVLNAYMHHRTLWLRPVRHQHHDAQKRSA